MEGPKNDITAYLHFAIRNSDQEGVEAVILGYVVCLKPVLTWSMVAAAHPILPEKMSR